MIQYPLIHLVLAGIVASYLVYALVQGELTVNSTFLKRSRHPIRYWLGIALGCFLVYAFGGPALHEMLK
jgi:hypothetical protein